MKNYWNNLNERERWTVSLGAFFCVFYLFYLLLYAPLANSVYDKSRQLREKQDTLAWMKQVRIQHKSTQTPTVLTSSQLLTRLAEQLHATSFQKYPYQLQQTGVGDIQLSFEKVPYNAFITWLWSINQKFAISVKQFNSERTETAGIVKLIIVIEAKSI